MIFNRILLFQKCFSGNFFNKLKCFSSLPKQNNKIKEIKNLVLNQNKLDSNSSDLKNKKSVLIYSNENATHYRKIFLINCLQFVFWMYCANQGTALILPQKPKPLTESDIKEELRSDAGLLTQTKLLWKENKIQMLLSFGILICGQISMSLLSLYTIRSIRYIILSPSGRNVTLTTFSITGSANRYRNYVIPIENISAFQYRNSARNYIPLKVKGKWFYFLVDTSGHFYKPSLFDQTVGVFRVLK